MVTSNTFQKSFTRMLVGTGLISLVLSLLYQAQHAWALLECVQSGIRAVMNGAAVVIGAVYAGSVALNGLTLVLLVGTTHAFFWSRAEWAGKRFAVPEQPALAKMSKACTWVGALGYLFLVSSLCEYAETRSSLDSMLGLVMLAVLLKVLSHKGRMLQIVIRHSGWESGNYGNLIRGIGSALAAFAVAVLINARFPFVWSLPLWGMGYGVLSYMLLQRFRLPDVGRGAGLPDNCYKME